MTFISLNNIIKLLTKYWSKFLVDGVSYTLLLSAITVGFGAVLACLIAWMKTAKIAPVRWLATAYIEIIRGTPMLLQLYFFYFALPSLIPALNKQKFLCIAIALICNSAAYVSEVIRSGLQSVDAGQTEAVRSLGMSAAQCTWHIIVPQALRTILPALGNEFVMIIKDTSPMRAAYRRMWCSPRRRCCTWCARTRSPTPSSFRHAWTTSPRARRS